MSEQIPLGLVLGFTQNDEVTDLCCILLDIADAKDIRPWNEGVILTKWHRSV